MPNKPIILIFIDWYKPGFKAGGPIRSISNLVDYLIDQFDVYIVTRDTDYLEVAPYNSIKPNEWNEIDSAKVYYLSEDQLSRKKISALVSDINPNFIYCNSLYSLYFTLIPLYLAKKSKIQSILAVRGMLSKGSLGVKSTKKRIFLSGSKLIGLFNSCIFHATNESEKKDIQNTFGEKTNIVIAQNLPEKKQLAFFRRTKTNNGLKLVFIGRLAPEKNVHFALEVLAHVTEKVEFDIYGPIYAQNYWDKCKSLINQLPSNIVVNYKGVLEHDKIDDTLKKYHSLFLPSTGENFGHIIIEAMANSCIPLISDQTPWKDLEEQNVGYDLSLNDLKLFAKTIDKLSLLNQDDFNVIANNAHGYATNIINNKKLIEDYNKLFQLN